MKKKSLADLRFGMIAIRKKLATKEQVDKALGFQRQVYEQKDKYILLGDILIQSGVITTSQRDDICSIQQFNQHSVAAKEANPESVRERNRENFNDRRFGMIAVKKGFATRDQIDRALYMQKIAAQDDMHVRIGEILVKTAVIAKAQNEEILRTQDNLGNPAASIFDRPGAAPDDGAGMSEADKFSITISDDKLEAHIQPEGNTLSGVSLDTVKHALALKGITYGVLDDSILAQALGGGSFRRKPLLVASGKAPEDGRDGKVIHHFAGESVSAGKPERVNTPTIQNRQVKRGDLIAEKIPSVEGTPGADIYGNPAPPKSLADVVLAAGHGAELSVDGNRVTASDDGYAEASPDGSISVYPCLKISGDAGHANGNIEFDGHIEIEGVIEDGIHVKGRSLWANEIYESKIDMTGNVNVTKGISDAEIKTMGTLSATHTNKAKIEAFGDVIIENEIIHSDVQTNGKCLISKGFIRTSKVSARKGIIGKDVGSEISGPCTLSVGVDYQAKKEIARIKEQVAEERSQQNDLKRLVDELEQKGALLQERIDKKTGEEGPLKVERAELQKQIEAFDDANDGEEKHAVEVALEDLDLKMVEIRDQVVALLEDKRKVSDKRSMHRFEMEKIGKKIEELKSGSDRIGKKMEMEKKNADIEILGTIFRNNVVSGLHAKLTMPENHRGVRIKEGLTADSKSSVSWFMKISNI